MESSITAVSDQWKEPKRDLLLILWTTYQRDTISKKYLLLVLVRLQKNLHCRFDDEVV